MLAWIPILVSTVAIAVSVTSALIQRNSAKQARLLSAFNDSLTPFYDEAFRRHMRYIRNELVGPADGAGGRRHLTPDDKDHTAPVSTFFNTMGVLLVNGIVPSHVLASIMGRSVLDAWDRIGPYIHDERTERGGDPNYFAYFEHLAAVVADNPPERLAALLKLRTREPGCATAGPSPENE